MRFLEPFVLVHDGKLIVAAGTPEMPSAQAAVLGTESYVPSPSRYFLNSPKPSV